MSRGSDLWECVCPRELSSETHSELPRDDRVRYFISLLPSEGLSGRKPFQRGERPLTRVNGWCFGRVLSIQNESTYEDLQ